MKFLTFSSKKLPNLRKKFHSLDEIAFDEHGETMWKKMILQKKTVCTKICYRLRAGSLRQFSRSCFLHIQGYTSGRKCRPKNRTINFVLKSDIKTIVFQRNFSTRLSILHSSCSKTPFGKKCGQRFSDHKNFLSMCRNFPAGC